MTNNETMIGMFGIELALELVQSFIDKGLLLAIQFINDDGTLGNRSDLKPISITTLRGRTYLRTKNVKDMDVLIELKQIVSVHPVNGFGNADT